MKFSKQFSGINLGLTLLVLILSCNFFLPSFSQINSNKLQEPDKSALIEENLPTNIELKEIPVFPNKLKTGNKRVLSTALIPLDERLRLIIYEQIDTKSSEIGDIFKATVLEDFKIPSNPPVLLIPKGSWIKGRIIDIKKSFIWGRNRSITIQLDNLTTSTGEIISLYTVMHLEKGALSSDGKFNLSDNVTTQRTNNNKQIIDIRAENINASLINRLIGESCTGLFNEGEKSYLSKGQELQLLLQANINLHL